MDGYNFLSVYCENLRNVNTLFSATSQNRTRTRFLYINSILDTVTGVKVSSELLIHGFAPVETWLLIVCGTRFKLYAIMLVETITFSMELCENVQSLCAVGNFGIRTDQNFCLHTLFKICNNEKLIEDKGKGTTESYVLLFAFITLE